MEGGYLFVIIALIFCISVGIILFISGLFKVFGLKAASESIIAMNVIPVKFAKPISLIFPFIELLIGILLIFSSESIIVNIMAISLIVIFVLVNFQAVVDKRQKPCFCFGKMIETKIGYGGMVQSLLLLISILVNVIFNNMNLIMILDQGNQVVYVVLIVTVSIFWAVTLILIRIIMENILTNK
ncbi:TPA: hypothetical protein QCY05_002990 [Bacillus wiedmannii]|nr:hypothetical protein [Bacillus wiedmannii]